MSVSIARSSKCSGWFPVGPHYDSLISQQESATQTSTKCWFNSIRLISYTGDPAVVGRSDWMRRCAHRHAHTHTTNLALQTFHSDWYFLMPSLSYCSVRPPPTPVCVVVVCMHGASAFVWVCMRDCTSFTTHVWLYYAFKCVRECMFVRVCGSWHCSRPIGGLALTRMSPQAPVLVGCLVLALHVSWLSAVRLYPTLGRLPGAGAILPSPWTSPSHPPHSPRPHVFLTG